MYSRFVQQAAKQSFQQSNAFRATPRKFALPDGVKQYTETLALSEQPKMRTPKAAINELFYTAVLKNNSSYFAFVGVLCFGFQYTLDTTIGNYIKNYNKGMSYEDVIATFPEIPPNCDE